jgi:hypothetical protein
VIAAGQVGAADASGKKHISSEQNAGAFVKETKGAGTMPRHKEYLKINIIQNLRFGFIKQKVGLDRFHFELKTESAEKIGVGHHRERVAMIGDFAAELPLDARCVQDVVHMPVREQQERDFVSLIRKPLGRALRGVEKNAVFLEEKAIRVKGAAGEGSDSHAGDVYGNISGGSARIFRRANRNPNCSVRCLSELGPAPNSMRWGLRTLRGAAPFSVIGAGLSPEPALPPNRYLIYLRNLSE